MQFGEMSRSQRPCFEIETKGKDRYTRKRQHLTPRGQIVAAVRKCLSNIAATDMGKLLLTDISKDSFLKAEIILGATRVCSFRKFHEMFEQKLTASTSTTPGLVVHSFSDSAAEVGVRVRNPESRAPERVLVDLGRGGIGHGLLLMKNRVQGPGGVGLGFRCLSFIRATLACHSHQCQYEINKSVEKTHELMN